MLSLSDKVAKFLRDKLLTQVKKPYKHGNLTLTEMFNAFKPSLPSGDDSSLTIKIHINKGDLVRPTQDVVVFINNQGYHLKTADLLLFHQLCTEDGKTKAIILHYSNIPEWCEPYLDLNKITDIILVSDPCSLVNIIQNCTYVANVAHKF